MKISHESAEGDKRGLQDERKQTVAEDLHWIEPSSPC